MKKIFLLVIILCLTAVSASCSGTSPAGDETSFSSTQPLYTVSDERDLSFYFIAYRNSDAYYQEVFAPIIEELEQRASHLMIDLDFNWINYKTYIADIQKLIASGQDIDAFSYYSYGTVLSGDDFDSSLIMDITDIFPQYAPRLFGSIHKSTLESYSVSNEGRIYAIPNNYSYNMMYKSCVIARKDLFEKSSMAGITTLEEYGDFLRWVKENESGVLPGLFSDFYSLSNSYITGNGYYYGFSSYLYFKWEDEIPIAYTLDRVDPFLDLYSLLKEWSEEGLFQPQMPTSLMWDLGLCASTMTNMFYLREYLSTSTGSFDYVFFPLYPDSQLQDMGGSSYATMISAYSPDADRILMFYEWLFTDRSAYELIMYGIEDVNYMTKDTKIYAAEGMTSLINWEGCNTFRNYLYDRPSLFEPEGYSEMITECIYNKIADETPLDEVLDKYDSIPDDQKDEYDQYFSEGLNEARDLYSKCISDIMSDMYDGNFSLTLDMLTDRISDSGSKAISDNYNELISWILANSQ